MSIWVWVMPAAMLLLASLVVAPVTLRLLEMVVPLTRALSRASWPTFVISRSLKPAAMLSAVAFAAPVTTVAWAWLLESTGGLVTRSRS